MGRDSKCFVFVELSFIKYYIILQCTGTVLEMACLALETKEQVQSITIMHDRK